MMMMTEIKVNSIDNPEKSDIFYFDKGFQCDGFTKPGWYFWDETETNLIGPFSSAKKAQISKDVYFNNIEKIYKREYYHDGDGIIREIK
jgi:hypothetical protein